MKARDAFLPHNHHRRDFRIPAAMLPSPSSSPRAILQDLTNASDLSPETPIRVKPTRLFAIPTPPEHTSLKRPLSVLDARIKKKSKISVEQDGDNDSDDESWPKTRVTRRQSLAGQYTRPGHYEHPHGTQFVGPV